MEEYWCCGLVLLTSQPQLILILSISQVYSHIQYA